MKTSVCLFSSDAGCSRSGTVQDRICCALLANGEEWDVERPAQILESGTAPTDHRYYSGIGQNAGRSSMSDIPHLHVDRPPPTTYARRAEECRWLASVSPPEFRESYLTLAARYEQLANATETTTA
jgi:hypothetical protein